MSSSDFHEEPVFASRPSRPITKRFELLEEAEEMLPDATANKRVQLLRPATNEPRSTTRSIPTYVPAMARSTYGAAGTTGFWKRPTTSTTSLASPAKLPRFEPRMAHSQVKLRETIHDQPPTLTPMARSPVNGRWTRGPQYSLPSAEHAARWWRNAFTLAEQQPHLLQEFIESNECPKDTTEYRLIIATSYYDPKKIFIGNLITTELSLHTQKRMQLMEKTETLARTGVTRATVPTQTELCALDLDSSTPQETRNAEPELVLDDLVLDIDASQIGLKTMIEGPTELGYKSVPFAFLFSRFNHVNATKVRNSVDRLKGDLRILVNEFVCCVLPTGSTTWNLKRLTVYSAGLVIASLTAQDKDLRRIVAYKSSTQSDASDDDTSDIMRVEDLLPHDEAGNETVPEAGPAPQKTAQGDQPSDTWTGELTSLLKEETRKNPSTGEVTYRHHLTCERARYMGKKLYHFFETSVHLQFVRCVLDCVRYADGRRPNNPFRILNVIEDLLFEAMKELRRGRMRIRTAEEVEALRRCEDVLATVPHQSGPAKTTKASRVKNETTEDGDIKSPEDGDVPPRLSREAWEDENVGALGEDTDLQDADLIFTDVKVEPQEVEEESEFFTAGPSDVALEDKGFKVSPKKSPNSPNEATDKCDKAPLIRDRRSSKAERVGTKLNKKNANTNQSDNKEAAEDVKPDLRELRKGTRKSKWRKS